MNINFYSQYGYILLGLVEIYIGFYLFMMAYLTERYQIRRSKMPELRAKFLKAPVLTKIVLVGTLSLFVLSLMVFVLFLELPESQWTKNVLTMPMMLLGVLAFSYNSIVDSEKKGPIIEHLLKHKTFYKTAIAVLFCGLITIVGVRTLMSGI